MREIYIPIAQDSKNNLIQLKFDIQNTSALIVGRCGSGKTSLLKHISKYLVETYSTNDVAIHIACKNIHTDEIIKADKFEHVKSICYDNEEFKMLIETLLEEHINRLMFLRDAGYGSIHNVPDKEIMPMVFIFIDEIHWFLTNFVDETKDKLERIMSEGQVTGLKVVFTAQDYNNSLRFLSSAAKARIHQIALLTYPGVETSKHIVKEIFPQICFEQNDTFIREGRGVLLYNMRGEINMREGILLYDIEKNK